MLKNVKNPKGKWWKEVVLKRRIIKFLNFFASGCFMKALKTSHTDYPKP